MAEVSNNVVASLLVVAILISGMSVIAVSNFGGVSFTGGATSQTGRANISIGGQVAIEVHNGRNVTDFDSGYLAGAARILSTQADNDDVTSFDDGSEGNGTNYGSCDSTEGNCAFPFVIENTGNVAADINVSAVAEASTWIGAGAYALAKGKSNETTACHGFGTGFGEGSWVDLNTSGVAETQVCDGLSFGNSTNSYADTLRIHFQFGIPSDASGDKGTIVTVGATVD